MTWQIPAALAGYLKKHPVARKIAIVFFTLALIFLSIAGLAQLFWLLLIELPITESSTLFLGVTIVFFFITLNVVLKVLQSLYPQDTPELERIEKQREQIHDRIKEKEPDIFDTIRLSLNQLDEYYVINKSQARNSFRASVAASAAAFATLIGGIWLFLLSSDRGKTKYYLLICYWGSAIAIYWRCLFLHIQREFEAVKFLLCPPYRHARHYAFDQAMQSDFGAAYQSKCPRTSYIRDNDARRLNAQNSCRRNFASDTTKNTKTSKGEGAARGNNSI